MLFWWKTIHSAARVRVQRRDWELRVVSRAPAMLPHEWTKMDILTKAVTCWHGDYMLRHIPDHSQAVLFVGMHCAAIPQALRRAPYWRIHTVAGAQVVPQYADVAKAYFHVDNKVSFLDKNLAELSTSTFVTRYDAVIYDSGLAPSFTDLWRCSSLLGPGGRLIVCAKDAPRARRVCEYHMDSIFERVERKEQDGCVVLVGRLAPRSRATQPAPRIKRRPSSFL